MAVARVPRKAGLEYREMALQGPHRIRLRANREQVKAIIDSSILLEKGWKGKQTSFQGWKGKQASFQIYRYGIVRGLDDQATEEDILQHFTANIGQRILEAKRQQRREGDILVDSNTW